ncbi:MAG: endolytic transglycosylase MltG [Patescibacteria group bacterium]
MNFWLKLKEKVAVLLERESSHVQLIAWRNRVTKIVVFFDKNILKILAGALLLLFFISIFYFLAWRAPRGFPDQALVTVEKGESLSQVATSFEEKKIIRSDFWLKAIIFIMGGQKRVVAGDYYFPSSVNVFRVATMIHNGKFGLISIKVTIPEGSSSYEIAEILKKEIPSFDSKGFTSEVTDNNYEGFLFPDTYFFTPNVKALDVILMMRENFARQIDPYKEDILKSKKSLNDIVIMASIVEDESNSSQENKRIVAGILWERLRLKMPLQVDSAFQYYNGKNSYTLTKTDLAEDHPYNTYVNKGLPPTAITNPGIESIKAAIAPTQTKYLYFLSDKKGNMYYAKDFEEHKLNRELYLN